MGSITPTGSDDSLTPRRGSVASLIGTTKLPDGESVILEEVMGSLKVGESLSPRVLVVEDNLINRNLLVQWLRKKGYEYEEAEDGQQAVEVYSSRRPGYFQIVLIDVNMPRLSGLDATRQMRTIEIADASSRESTPIKAKIFALSGLASKDDKIRAFDAGVDGYLTKPVSFRTLATLFDQLANGST